MYSVGNCPGCKKAINNVTLKDMPIHEGFTPKFQGVAYTCPNCHVILGVQMDPISLKADMIAEFTRLLKK